MKRDYRTPFKNGEFPRDFFKMRDYIARENAYAYSGHFNSSVNMAMSMFKLSITSRWALMAARGWARLNKLRYCSRGPAG